MPNPIVSSRPLSRNEKIVLGTVLPIVALMALGSLNTPQPPTLANSFATPSATQTQAAEPVVTVREEVESIPIPFQKTTVDDPGLDVGTVAISTVGVIGAKTVTSRVTITDGIETARVVIKEFVTTEAVNEVTSIGSRVPPPAIVPFASTGCDGNYGGCVPIASDVDCAGGSGNGPAYVEGSVTVIGQDIYDLDRDGNGIGCD